MAFFPTISLTDIHVSLRNILNYLQRPLWVDPATSRIKGDVIISSGTVTTVSAVTAVTTLTQLAGFDAKSTVMFTLDRDYWANSIRNRIT